jgi:hypothetical protein
VSDLTPWVPAILLGAALLLLVLVSSRIPWRDKWAPFSQSSGDAQLRARAVEDAVRDAARVRHDEDLAP